MSVQLSQVIFKIVDAVDMRCRGFYAQELETRCLLSEPLLLVSCCGRLVGVGEPWDSG